MIFYGINPVLEALRSDRLPARIFISKHKKSPSLAKIRDQAKRRSIPLDELDNLQQVCTSKETQGVCAELAGGETKRFDLEELSADRLVMLDGLQDPHNFGAALRVCEVFGYRDVIFQKGNSCGVTAAAIKASAGAYFHINLYQAGLNNAVKRLKDSGYTIVACDGTGEAEITSVRLEGKACITVGSEQKGVRFAIKRQADHVVRIPVAGQVNSLNVSCALAVALYQFVQS